MFPGDEIYTTGHVLSEAIFFSRIQSQKNPNLFDNLK